MTNIGCPALSRALRMAGKALLAGYPRNKMVEVVNHPSPNLLKTMLEQWGMDDFGLHSDCCILGPGPYI